MLKFQPGDFAAVQPLFYFPFLFDLCRLQLTILSISICQEKRGFRSKNNESETYEKVRRNGCRENITGCLKGGSLEMGSE